MALFRDRVDIESLEFVINHVFLPPQLPQGVEEHINDKNKALLQILRQSSDYCRRIFFNRTSIWPTVVKLVDHFRTFENNSAVSAQDFAMAVEHMQDQDVVGIHITSQNAGLVLRRIGDRAVFSSFEASPISAAVTEATGKLLISYPGPAIGVEWKTVVEAGFLKRFSEFVEMMKHDPILIASGRGMKAGEILQEDRESTHPMFITEMLTGILRGVGQEVEVERFVKRIGDEVLWDNTLIPWRRSPLWLVVRVSLRMVLGQEDYKSFMILFMAQVLVLSIQKRVRADRLFVMNAKLARRVHKVGDRLPKFVLDEAWVAAAKASKYIQDEWMRTQRNGTRNPWRDWRSVFYSGAVFVKDTIITMHNSRDYVKRVSRINCAKPEREAFTPAEKKRIYNRKEWWMPKTSLLKDSKLVATQDIMLADVERWVMEGLDVWLNSWPRERESLTAACNLLGGAIRDYMEIATVAYKGNPERSSIMILTVMELWVVLDKLVVALYPLILRYLPELNEYFLCALLLPQSQQRVRLSSIENYIKQRRLGASPTSVSVFSQEVTEHTFSVCYFQSCDELIQLETKIINEAIITRQLKISELAKKRVEYENLLAEIRTMTCEYFTHRRDGWTRHDRFCKKCAKVKKADDMRIEVHEWPLPDDRLARAATVFELQCPRPFSIWREATFRILNDLFTPSGAQPGNRKPFDNVYTYSGLKVYSTPEQKESPRGTLCYTSMTKSFLSSHYRSQRLPTAEEEICVRNALNFALYDTRSGIWAFERPSAVDCRHLCAFRLPKGPYASLQYTVTGTSHTPNQVLAQQFKCPPEIQLHEYVAFGLLRSGWRIQWLNMLRELRSRTLTFSAEPVSMLYLQAAWQVGPPSGESKVQRESHIEPGEEEFGGNLINELWALLKGVEENWQEVTTAQTMIVLAIQVLAATTSDHVASSAVNFLKEVRRVCLVWTRELAGKLPECDPGDVRESQMWVIQMAATCRMTYDVEDRFLLKMLQTTQEVAVYVECATTIHHNLPGVAGVLPMGIKRLLVRDTRMSYAIEEHLRQLVIGGYGKEIDLKPIWSAYERGASWLAMESPNERWVYTYTAGGEGRESQKVHYNLISGELLVEGLPLGRMPAAYTNHPTYKELFQEKVLDVYPSNMSGMIFQTRHAIYGYRVSFAMQEPENELIIRTERKEDGKLHQFIPSSKLHGDFPTNTISRHVFWLDLPPATATLSGYNPRNGGKINLRNRTKPWSTEGVYISNVYDEYKTVFRLSDNLGLIDVRSRPANAITTVLAPLEDAQFIEVTYGMGIVKIHLPRLKLDFRVDWYHRIECKQFPGMVIDGDQSIGTFIGLQNFLVVRQGLVRSVIIPHGKIVFDQQDNHTIVKVEIPRTEKDVKYHVYTLNPILETVVGNGSLRSHLYKIYLHAVTSHCLPDPFTRRTGTEEALHGLRAAATMSFQRVKTDSIEADLFRLISDLTPIREYYPIHLKSMQHVKWMSGLPPLAQHEEFREVVKEVSQYAQLLSIFEDVGGSILSRDIGVEVLRRKAAKRNAIFRAEQFGGNMAEEKTEDREYMSRDMVEGSMDEARVAYVAHLVKRWGGSLNIHQNLLSFLEQQGEIRGSAPRGARAKMELGYSHRWLDAKPAEVWVALYNALRGGGGPSEKYDWLFLLTPLAYLGKIELKLIETLMAFGTVEAFKTIEPPMHPSYDLSHGYEPKEETLINVIQAHTIPFEDSEESQLDTWPLESEQDAQQRRSNAFNKNKGIQAKNMARELRLSWPSLELSVADEMAYPLYDVPAAILAVEPCFEIWRRNSEFRHHIFEVQQILNTTHTYQEPILSPYYFTPCEYSPSKWQSTIRLSDLLKRPPPTLPPLPNLSVENPIAGNSSADSKPKDHSLEDLLRDFQDSHTGKLQTKYTNDLEESIRAFRTELAPPDSTEEFEFSLKNLRKNSEWYMRTVFRAIENQLGPHAQLRSAFMVFQAGLWPRLCPILFLQQLATNCTNELSLGWKKVFTSYALAMATVQRLDRLIRISPKGTITPEISSDFFKELENTGHAKWDPLDHPDWLLIEIENNLLIRPVQADIASKMIAPPGNSNKIMQLCMGEGKTSVIVPIVAASLADTERLVRVVVLKPLSGQMFQTLVQKLGGLVNRRIFFMPFSRGIPMGKDEIRVVKQLYDDCLKERGVLLVQPEHILSFKLLGLEWLYNSTHESGRRSERIGGTGKKYDRQVARLLLDTQTWLDKTSRDILDESDEILNVKHELIYTIGNPVPIQSHPDRWIIIQEIFDLIKMHFNNLKTSVQDFEMERHTDPTRFGSIRILNLNAGRDLLSEIAGRIVEDQRLTVSFRLFPTEMRALTTRFISDANMNEEEAAPLFEYLNENSITNDILYLLRGLIAHNILLFSLKEKRWKVDYGLDLKRSLLAVPYRAKDSPSGKAEFSHPDVAITLTCLSYYYGGLDKEQLETCFKNLYKSDNPSLQYERWIKGVVLPKPYLQRLNGINLEDRVQWEKTIYPTFRFNKAVIDSYLSGVVFPKEAKEFPYKLSTSGWDVAASKTNPTTGFSGTNDNRYLLPLSIEQFDTTEQMNTNARVLSYLLQGGNNYKCIAGGPNNNERVSVVELLKMLVKRPDGRQIDVLLDVGAQVLELRNDEVAKTWLSLVSDAQGAVYFDDNDVLTVITRYGNPEPLMISAFADRLDRCLVYLDEAHTRGTDLKLPIKTRAAVTLGPNLTKDRLVQACMRMRKLGNGHTVLFCGPPEIDRKIMEIAKKDNRDAITVRDVLYWCMEETCENTQKLLPIWAKQGINHQKHLKAWNYIGDGRGFPGELREKESKTLIEHYGFQRLKEESIDSYRKSGPKGGDLSKILDMCKSLGVKSFRGAKMLEEQERELAHEVECERENQRPEQAGPAKNVVSEDIKQFISTGILQKSSRRSKGVIPAFSVLERTSANKNFVQPNAFSQKLLATVDFCRVIDGLPLKDNKTDDFLRPVNWILSSTVDKSILLIMSPYEVNRLLPDIRKSSKVLLHMYSPQVTRSTPSYDLLDFCTIPSLPSSWRPDIPLIDQLNIFAGQLYFRDYATYERVCGFLGLCLNEGVPLEKRHFIHSDGFVNVKDREEVGMTYQSPFEKSPVTLLRELIGFRRKGQSYIATHIGHIVHGRFLTEDDFKLQEVKEDFDAQEPGEGVEEQEPEASYFEEYGSAENLREHQSGEEPGLEEEFSVLSVN